MENTLGYLKMVAPPQHTHTRGRWDLSWLIIVTTWVGIPEANIIDVPQCNSVWQLLEHQQPTEMSSCQKIELHGSLIPKEDQSFLEFKEKGGREEKLDLTSRWGPRPGKELWTSFNDHSVAPGESSKKRLKERWEIFRFAFPKGRASGRLVWGERVKSLLPVIEGRHRQGATRVEMGGVQRSRKTEGAAYLVVDGGWWQKKELSQGKTNMWQLRSPQNSSQKCSMEALPQPSWSSLPLRRRRGMARRCLQNFLYPSSGTSINMFTSNYWVQSSQILITPGALIWNS